MSTRRLVLHRPRLHLAALIPSGGVLWVRGFLGRHLSVRAKLTLWYGIMCALTIAVVGYGMRQTLDLQIQRSVDADLHATGVKLTDKLSRSADAGYTVQVPSREFQLYVQRVTGVLRSNSYLLSRPGQVEQIQLYNLASSPPENCILQPQTREPCVDNSSAGGIPALAETAAITSRVATFKVPEYATLTLNGQQVRAYFTPLYPPAALGDQVGGVLEVFQSERDYAEIASVLNLILLFGIPLALAVALGAGWWIARAALRPIDRISRTVKTIGESRDLSRRVRFVGPEDELGRLAQTFDHMMDRLESVFETQKRFVADASHELRTPLTAIRGNADLLAIAPPEERDICILSIRREAERMSRLVSDLLLLAAADVEDRPVHMQAVALDEVLRDVYRSATVIAGDTVAVSLDVRDPVVIQGDADRIKQLVLNLADNAIKFTPDGGCVRLRLSAEMGGARIEVHDTGPGIPADQQHRIFQRFYRVEESRSTRGSGLGLAICAWIAQAHGGHIEVDSAPGEGSVFVVHLPAHRAFEMA